MIQFMQELRRYCVNMYGKKHDKMMKTNCKGFDHNMFSMYGNGYKNFNQSNYAEDSYNNF